MESRDLIPRPTILFCLSLSHCHCYTNTSRHTTAQRLNILFKRLVRFSNRIIWLQVYVGYCKIISTLNQILCIFNIGIIVLDIFLFSLPDIYFILLFLFFRGKFLPMRLFSAVWIEPNATNITVCDSQRNRVMYQFDYPTYSHCFYSECKIEATHQVNIHLHHSHLSLAIILHGER